MNNDVLLDKEIWCYNGSCGVHLTHPKYPHFHFKLCGVDGVGVCGHKLDSPKYIIKIKARNKKTYIAETTMVMHEFDKPNFEYWLGKFINQNKSKILNG